MKAPEGGVIKVVKLVKKKFKAREGKISESCKIKFGQLSRTVISNKGFFGGLGPRGLNYSGVLDHFIFDGTQDKSEDDISNIIEAVLFEEEINEADVYLSLPIDSDLFSNLPIGESDRLIIFTGKSFNSFVANLDYVVADAAKRYK